MLGTIRHIYTKTTEAVTALHMEWRREKIQPDTSTSRFTFLKLPPELRNKIYRLVLVNVDTDPWGDIASIPLTQPAIARVNRLIRAESLSIFYRENNFHLSISLQDPAATDLEDKRRLLLFLRSVRLLALSGNFDLIDQLDLTCQPMDSANLRVQIRISNRPPPVYVREMPSTHYRLIMPERQGRWDVNDVDGEYTDWNDMDSVKFSMDIQKLILCAMLVEEHREYEAECLKNMPSCRIGTVLHQLLSGGDTRKFVFASTRLLVGPWGRWP